MIDYFRRTMKHLKLLPIILLLSSCSLIGDLIIPKGWGVSEYTINCRDIYKVSGTSIGYDVSDRNYYLKPQFTNDKRFSLESLKYYDSLGTRLHFIVETNGANPWIPDIVALDWRISKIEAITLVELDKSHPANSSVSDLIYLRKNWSRDPKKLSEIRYGDAMLQKHLVDKSFPRKDTKDVGLTDYSFVLEPTGNPTVDLDNIEIHIYTAFGDHFIARSETKEQEDNEKDNNNII